MPRALLGSHKGVRRVFALSRGKFARTANLALMVQGCTFRATPCEGKCEGSPEGAARQAPNKARGMVVQAAFRHAVDLTFEKPLMQTRSARCG
jgi:hypothetical protein